MQSLETPTFKTIVKANSKRVPANKTLFLLGSVVLTLYSDVVARDFGFAPNPFYGICTLATCKPRIRKPAKIGDWILGTGSKTRGREGRVVFAMRVSGHLTFDQYWKDPRFSEKKPNMRGSKKQAFGDNIYHRDGKTGRWRQADSHHSHPDGTPNQRNIKNDTQADRVLFSDDFVYWGGSGPAIPKRFRNFDGHDICGKRNHKNNFPAKMIVDFVAWLRSLGETNYCAMPLDWNKSP